jgi:hypothetical protein
MSSEAEGYGGQAGNMTSTFAGVAKKEMTSPDHLRDIIRHRHAMYPTLRDSNSWLSSTPYANFIPKLPCATSLHHCQHF